MLANQLADDLRSRGVDALAVDQQDVTLKTIAKVCVHLEVRILPNRAQLHQRNAPFAIYAAGRRRPRTTFGSLSMPALAKASPQIRQNR